MVKVPRPGLMGLTSTTAFHQGCDCPMAALGMALQECGESLPSPEGDTFTRVLLEDVAARL